MARQRRPRPVHCQGWRDDGAACDGTATWRKDWTQGSGLAAPGPGYLCDGCGWAAGKQLASELDLTFVDDGRIRGPEDVALRIAGARARRLADPTLKGREVLHALHELYCQSAELDSWVEILAADTWAEAELTRRLGRKVHRTQVRRSRMALEGLGYVRRLRRPRRSSLVKIAATHKLEGRKPPIFVEVLKAPEEDTNTGATPTPWSVSRPRSTNPGRLCWSSAARPGA